MSDQNAREIPQEACAILKEAREWQMLDWHANEDGKALIDKDTRAYFDSMIQRLCDALEAFLGAPPAAPPPPSRERIEQAIFNALTASAIGALIGPTARTVVAEQIMDAVAPLLGAPPAAPPPEYDERTETLIRAAKNIAPIDAPVPVSPPDSKRND